MENDAKLLTRSEVQELLKVSGTTLTKYTKDRKLTFYRIGRRILFDRKQVLEELKSCKAT